MIQKTTITAVKVAGEWFDVEEGSFWWDSFMLIHGDPGAIRPLPDIHIAQDNGSIGFGFRPLGEGGHIYGPWSSIQAIRTA